MGLAEITRDSVLRAVSEYDRLGRVDFLSRHGYGEARSYMLVHDGRQYDSKAVLGVAHGYLPGQPALGAAEFSGGEATVVKRLQQLGFEVRALRNPTWARDELILACELVRQNDWRWLSAEDRRVVELSKLLQLLPLHPVDERGPKFRNSNGVARKTAEIATQHPEYRGRPTKGGALDAEVLQAFLSRPGEMQAAAEAIRRGVVAGAFNGLGAASDGTDDETEAPEGRLLERRHFARERDRKLRQRKINRVLGQHGRLQCEVCGFDFEDTYGVRGAGYAECHHVVPLHASGETTTRLQDLAVLCANCHRMIHRRTPWLTPQELRDLVQVRPRTTSDVESR